MTALPVCYQELPPAPALRHLVECYWFRRSGAPAPDRGTTRVLPDGCMDVILDLAGPSADPVARPRRYVVGTMRHALVVHRAGPEDVMGVRFRPGAAPAFLDLRAGELTDRIVGLDDIWVDAPRAWERVAEATTSHERARVADVVLLRMRQRGERGLDVAVLHACRRMAGGGVGSVTALARSAGIGRRQLERRFMAAVGLSPGEALRVGRFRRATGLLRDHPEWTIGRVAAEAGYHDQPHLTRDFRAFAGLTPGRYRRESRGGDDASVQDARAPSP